MRGASAPLPSPLSTKCSTLESSLYRTILGSRFRSGFGCRHCRIYSQLPLKIWGSETGPSCERKRVRDPFPDTLPIELENLARLRIQNAEATVDSKKLGYGCRVIYAWFPSFCFLDQRTAIFQLSGFYCTQESVTHLQLRNLPRHAASRTVHRTPSPPGWPCEKT